MKDTLHALLLLDNRGVQKQSPPRSRRTAVDKIVACGPIGLRVLDFDGLSGVQRVQRRE
jgi:hypothetical protein